MQLESAKRLPENATSVVKPSHRSLEYSRRNALLSEAFLIYQDKTAELQSCQHVYEDAKCTSRESATCLRSPGPEESLNNPGRCSPSTVSPVELSSRGDIDASSQTNLARRRSLKEKILGLGTSLRQNWASLLQRVISRREETSPPVEETAKMVSRSSQTTEKRVSFAPVLCSTLSASNLQPLGMIKRDSCKLRWPATPIETKSDFPEEDCLFWVSDPVSGSRHCFQDFTSTGKCGKVKLASKASSLRSRRNRKRVSPRTTNYADTSDDALRHIITLIPPKELSSDTSLEALLWPNEERLVPSQEVTFSGSAPNLSEFPSSVRISDDVQVSADNSYRDAARQIRGVPELG